MASKSRFTFRPRVRRLDGTPPPEVCLSRLRDHACVVLLHSAAGEPRRYSLLAFDPLCDAHGALVELRQELGGLRELRAQLAPAAGDVPPPQFAGGVLAALAYDLGVHGEPLELPRDVDDTPHVVGGLYTDYLLFDHERHATWLVLGEDPGDARASVREREARVMAELEDEPTLLAPRSQADAAGRRKVWQSLMPLAASVMGVAAVGLVFIAIGARRMRAAA